MAQFTDPYAFSRGWDDQQQQFDRRNAFAEQRRQQDIENARANEQLSMQRAQFEQQQQNAQQQIQGQLAEIAVNAGRQSDPQVRSGIMRQAIENFVPPSQRGAKLAEWDALPQEQKDQHIRQLIGMRGPPKPIEVSAGASLVTQNPDGSYSSAFTAPKSDAESGFTLSPEQIRYDAKGNVVARGAPKDTKLSKPEGFDIA